MAMAELASAEMVVSVEMAGRVTAPAVRAVMVEREDPEATEEAEPEESAVMVETARPLDQEGQGEAAARESEVPAEPVAQRAVAPEAPEQQVRTEQREPARPARRALQDRAAISVDLFRSRPSLTAIKTKLVTPRLRA